MRQGGAPGWCAFYSNVTEYCEWPGCRSRSYRMRQGGHQGGVLSTYLCKVYNNGLLEQLVKEGNGVFIGTSFMVTPTCANDMLNLAYYDVRLQSMLMTSEQYSDSRRFIITQ